jgi:hypothetical protein
LLVYVGGRVGFGLCERYKDEREKESFDHVYSNKRWEY